MFHFIFRHILARPKIRLKLYFYMIKDSKIPTKANALIITYGCPQLALKASHELRFYIQAVIKKILILKDFNLSRFYFSTVNVEKLMYQQHIRIHIRNFLQLVLF